MSLRPEAEFRTTLPEDGVEDEAGFVEFPGRSIMEAIGAMLSVLGYEVPAPIHAGEHGWELDVRAKGRRFWLQVTWMGESDCILSTMDMTWQFWRTQPSFEEFLTQLDTALREDARFSQIGWFRDWKDKTRSPHPVGAG